MQVEDVDRLKNECKGIFQNSVIRLKKLAHDETMSVNDKINYLCSCLNKKFDNYVDCLIKRSLVHDYEVIKTGSTAYAEFLFAVNNFCEDNSIDPCDEDAGNEAYERLENLYDNDENTYSFENTNEYGLPVVPNEEELNLIIYYIPKIIDEYINYFSGDICEDINEPINL
ncbi:hypothetical protein DY052_06200 [Apilactobacillus timberlakei]|uniref:hypothetical protein n=1 Tax=Apilactobacillus timberlakei TaxID=2008380 RepID=UPI00112D81F9|nr:hypothetical protein [Apilactobacillus timberlakei]TPR15015.1 hypothetical protein DY052_06200 [Apilactobacillus timberlakei]